MAQFITTPRRAAHDLNLGLNYIYRLIWEGKLSARKVGIHWEIDKASMKAYKRKRKTRLDRRKQ